MLDENKPLVDVLAPLFDGKPWGSPVEVERRRRINVAAWAYAYEVDNNPIVDDDTFDREARLINPSIDTGHDILDAFFRAEFSPHTGMWVHRHPEKHKLPGMCARRRKHLTKS